MCAPILVQSKRSSRPPETNPHSCVGTLQNIDVTQHLANTTRYHNSDHQMTEVISGYRLALVYDIINFEQPFLTTSVSKVSQQMDPLYDVFSTWKQTHEDLRHRYIYVLPNTYEDDDLNLDILSGGDLAIARALKEVNRELSFTTFLARIESRKTGTLCDYDYDDYDTETVHEMEHVKRETLSLEEVTDLSGRSLVKDVSIKKEEVLQEDWTEYVNPEEIEYSYMESTATHVFRSAVGPSSPRLPDAH